MAQLDPRSLAFDDIVIDFSGRRLLRGGDEVALEPKAFAVLALLAGSPGRVFTRDEILDAVWGHRHVTQSVLNRIMSLLRQALGEDAQSPRRLHTIYGVGYRFDLPAAANTARVGADALGSEGTATPTALPATSTMAAAIRSHGKGLGVAAAVSLLAMILVVVQLTRAGGEETQPVAPATATPAQPSLAVLPFVDLSGAQDQEYLADGLAEEIRSQLAQSTALRVVGRTSSVSFKGKNLDLRTIGRQLGVGFLLEGSVRREGNELRVTAQLVRADDGTNLWSRTYARDMRNVFAVQEELSLDVAQALSVTLDVATYNREQGGTTVVEAYERFLRWRSSLMLERFDFAHDRERLQLAREMVTLDPQCVLCWDALAGSLTAMAQELGGEQAQRLRAEAQEVRDRIARIAPDSWVAKRDRANSLWREGRRAEAIALAKQVADAGPPTKERAWDYAYMLYAMGRLDETIALVEQVRAIEPMALFLSRDLQYDYTAARRYQDAEAEYQRGRTLEGSQLGPDHVAFFRQLAGQRPGGLEELRTLHERLRQHRNFDSPFFLDLAPALGDRKAMLALVRRALADEVYSGGAAAAFVRTSVADALGDADLAVASLRKDLEAQEGYAQGRMAHYPYVALWNAPYSGLRAHPEFKRLLVETGVVDYWRQSGQWGDGCGPLPSGDFQCR